ncbi:MAG TPA: hypothetical protein VFV30_08435, partial [Novosphingobium sp.]|nr:hypothetical protein [Novosphingobium sp.]
AEPFEAPLPAGYEPSGQPRVPGLYAEVLGLSSIFDERQLEELDEACAPRGKVVTLSGQENRGKGAVRIYRTATAVAVVTVTSNLSIDTETCTASYALTSRATVRTGKWKYSEVPYFQNPKLDCRPNRRIGRCSEQEHAGITVTCRNNGDGFVGDAICVSNRKDLTRGLVFAYESYVDDDSMPTGGWALQRVETDALIDPAVFAKRDGG